MSTVDELLAALQAEEEAAEAAASGDTGEGSNPAAESNVMKQIRDRNKALTKALKEEKARADAAEAYRVEVETAKNTALARNVFKGANLPEKQADLFLKIHQGEVTEEAAKQFIVDNELGVIEDVAPTQPKDSFEPGGPGVPVPAGRGFLSDEEAATLRSTDAKAYIQAMNDGRIKRVVR